MAYQSIAFFRYGRKDLNIAADFELLILSYEYRIIQQDHSITAS